MCYNLRKWSKEMVRHQEISWRRCVLQQLQGWSLQQQEVLVTSSTFYITYIGTVNVRS